MACGVDLVCLVYLVCSVCKTGATSGTSETMAFIVCRIYCVGDGYSFAVSLTGPASRWACAGSEAATAEISDRRVSTTIASCLSSLILIAYCSVPEHITLGSIALGLTIR